MWNRYKIEDVATPSAWEADPEIVLQFYNERKIQAAKAQQNAAHLAIAELEAKYEVIVITQNIEDLHERAGLSNIIYVHGEITKARSSIDSSLIYPIDGSIQLGDKCEKESQFISDIGTSISNLLRTTGVKISMPDRLQ